MKKLYTVTAAIFFFGLGSVFGQTLLEPTLVEVDEINALTDFEGVGYSTVTNQGASTVEYTWSRNTIEITSGWTSAICDINQCYLTMVSSQDFELEPGASGNLDVHLYPNGLEGNAIIEVVIQGDDDPENNVTGTYLFSTGTLSTPERITNALKIYPNPVVSEFFIEGADDVERVEIYSIDGKLVKQVQSFGKGSVNVDDLGTGNYIVRMWDDANKQISSNVLSVQ